MWYVLQVRTGSEERIIAQCKNIMSEEILKRCFVPYYEEKKKIDGEWKKLQKLLFPGYIFMVSEHIDEVEKQMKKVFGMKKILKTGEEIVAISKKEENLLKRLGLDDKELVEMSEGIIEGEQIIVTDGPLIGMEGIIRKVDRHKRKCWFETEMFGRMQRIEIGLEIVEKRETLRVEE